MKYKIWFLSGLLISQSIAIHEKASALELPFNGYINVSQGDYPETVRRDVVIFTDSVIANFRIPSGFQAADRQTLRIHNYQNGSVTEQEVLPFETSVSSARQAWVKVPVKSLGVFRLKVCVKSDQLPARKICQRLQGTRLQ